MEEIRVVNRNLGKPNSHTLEVFRAGGGYAQAERALTSMSPEDVIALIEVSELKGRGGAFFPTGMKWKFVRADPTCRVTWWPTATRANPERTVIARSWKRIPTTSSRA